MEYIHQLPSWPTFTWRSAVLATQLADVRHRQGLLLGRMSTIGFDLQTQASLETLTAEVVKSSEIEGERLNRQQVRSSIARRLGIDIGALTPAERNVDGVVEMMLDATQKFAEPLTAERLFGWHAALFPSGHSGISKIKIGGWRDDHTGPMQVVSGPIGRERVHFEAPPAQRMDEEMRRFLDWFNGGPMLDPVLKAGIAHLWFVTIHPFDDGNGRIARAIADMALARSEGNAQRFYSMSARIREEREAYYDVLEATQKNGLDITRWLEWFLDCLGKAIELADVTLTSVIDKARFWERNADRSFNDRQRQILNRLLDGSFVGKLTSSKWAKLTKSSQDTALRDISDLVEKQVLSRDPGGGRSTSYSLNVASTKPSRTA